MGLSKKEINIIALLIIDSIFFLLEIIVGYAVNSLALVADSFHMLNDIVSLLVALWAVNVAKTREADSKYTYGWQRAEILGALINAVFLLALCFTIFIEAIQRFVMPQEVSNPKLILIVGTCGLISNFVGLFLFHEHGHSHGFDEEEGVGHSHSHGGGHSHGHSHSDHVTGNKSLSANTPIANEDNDEDLSIRINDPSIDEVMPTTVIDRIQRAKSPHSANHNHHDDEDSTHETHNHVVKQGSKEEGNGKSLNMHGVFLHVMGDALGNVGVMATAIFIWKTEFSWRFYSDPLVSLIITVIIFSSALPLCKSASRILLQGTPTTIAFEDVREDILQINGVLSLHDFHIWNLTESMLIASLHVDLSVSPEQFLDIAKTIKECLHAYGIHSATIQPEFTDYYTKVNKLPKRFSTASGLATLGTLNDNNNNYFNSNEPGESTNLLNSSDTSKQYGSNMNPQGDITCIVDAAGNCTSDQCVRK